MTDRATPTTYALPRGRREADKALLTGLAELQRPPHRVGRQLRVSYRILLVGGLVVGVLTGGGVAAATGVLSPLNTTIHNVARCYSRFSTDFSSSFPGVDVAVAQTNRYSATVDVPRLATDLCSAVWSYGFSSPGVAPPRISRNNPVPALVVCVLPSGEAAVFPGTATTCTRLGLPLMSSQARRGSKDNRNKGRLASLGPLNSTIVVPKRKESIVTRATHAGEPRVSHIIINEGSTRL